MDLVLTAYGGGDVSRCFSVRTSGMTGAPVTFLFTNLASTDELLQRPGDVHAQRVLQAHHRLLKRCVTAHDGQDVRCNVAWEL